MKALVCRELGTPEKLVIDSHWPEPELKAGQVIIDVKAGSLNFPDLLLMQGKYQFQKQLPYVVGSECSGVVSAVAADVSEFQIGDRVVAVGPSAAFCERIVVESSSVFPMPDSLSFQQSAGICMAYFTAYHALRQKARLQSGETLLVLGAAGGVGSAALDIGRQMGAKVIAAASTEEKLQLAREMGADHTINYIEQSIKDAVNDLTDGKGVDVVYDPVGGKFSELALRCMAWNGRFLVVGFANGVIPRLPLNLVLLKNCEITGVSWGDFSKHQPEDYRQNINELWMLFNQGKLRPIVVDSFPLADYQLAYKCLSERRARGKVILNIAH